MLIQFPLTLIEKFGKQVTNNCAPYWLDYRIFLFFSYDELLARYRVLHGVHS